MIFSEYSEWAKKDGEELTLKKKKERKKKAIQNKDKGHNEK